MSDGDASARVRATDGDPLPSSEEDYDRMLDALDTAIEEAERKLENGRIRDAEKERARVKWLRALAHAVDVRRKVTVDRDLEQVAEVVEELRDQQEEEEP